MSWIAQQDANMLQQGLVQCITFMAYFKVIDMMYTVDPMKIGRRMAEIKFGILFSVKYYNYLHARVECLFLHICQVYRFRGVDISCHTSTDGKAICIITRIHLLCVFRDGDRFM